MKRYHEILKQLLSLAFPIIFANIISASSGLISMFFIATLTPQALAAGAIITSTYGLVTMMVVSVLYSVSILVGQNHGSDHYNVIGPIIFSGIALAFFIGIPLTCIMFYMTPILQLLQQPIEISEIAGKYFQGIAYGLIPGLIWAVFTQFFIGIAKAKLLLYFTFFGVLLNSIISYFFIFGFSTLKPMGVFGAGLATSLTSYISLALILIYVLLNSEFQKYRVMSKNAFNLNYCKLLLKIGTPISIQYTMELLVFSIITYLMGIIGTNALGAQQITLQFSMIAIMVVMGISQSGSILVSQSLGAETAADRKIISNCSFTVGGLFMLMIGVIYWLFPNILISLYLNIKDPSLSDTVSLARSILFIVAFTQIFDAGRNIAAGLLRGYGDTKSSMWAGLISCWIVGLPLAIIFAFYFHFGAIGLRLGIMFGILFGCIHLMSRVFMINKNMRRFAPGDHHRSESVITILRNQ
ncbi:MAG: MATE family efflux transporter [Legionella sp.]|nr:MATE family efflux transporter [Legionella sp.]